MKHQFSSSTYDPSKNPELFATCFMLNSCVIYCTKIHGSRFQNIIFFRMPVYEVIHNISLTFNLDAPFSSSLLNPSFLSPCITLFCYVLFYRQGCYGHDNNQPASQRLPHTSLKERMCSQVNF